MLLSTGSQGPPTPTLSAASPLDPSLHEGEVLSAGGTHFLLPREVLAGPPATVQQEHSDQAVFLKPAPQDCLRLRDLVSPSASPGQGHRVVSPSAQLSGGREKDVSCVAPTKRSKGARARLRRCEPLACVCWQPASEPAGTHAPGWPGGSGEESPQQSPAPQPPPCLHAVRRASIRAVGSVLSPGRLPSPISAHLSPPWCLLLRVPISSERGFGLLDPTSLPPTPRTGAQAEGRTL